MTHLLRYLLIFGDRKKKVELSVSQELENVKVETLKEKARELFSLKNVLLQIWDKGFEDWVDLDEGDPTPTNSRIKVEFDKDASSSAAVKPNPPPVTSLPNPKVDSPVVRVLSSHTSSYPPIALTTTELPIMLPTQKSLPPMSRLTQPQSVPSKQSIRTLPAGGQRQYLGEQPPGSSASARKPMVGAGQAIQDNSNMLTKTCHQFYPTSPIHTQDRPVLEYIQQSFPLSSRIPERTLLPSREDVPTRLTTSHSQNKPVMESLQQSLPLPYVQGSRIPERTLRRSQDAASYKLITSHSQNKSVMEVPHQSLPMPYVQGSRIPERTSYPSQDAESYRPITSHSQDKPVYETIQQYFPSPYIQSSRMVQERGFPPSQDIAPHQHHRITSNVQNTPVVQVVQESFSLQPYKQSLRIPETNLHVPTSKDKAPPPIIIEDDLSSGTSQEKSQMEDIHTGSLLDPEKLSLSDYKLPTFPADIIQKLENGIPIEAKERYIFLDVLYESIVPYTYYPSKSEYTYLTSKFLERFPQLVPQAGPIRDCPDNLEAWRQKLMHKFKNMRKRKDRNAAAVQEHTHKNSKYFEGLDSASGQEVDSTGDWVERNTPSETDEEVFEVVDDDQDVVIKEKDSMYHVMAADTTNLVDTSAIGVVQESISSSPYMQSSRIPERNLPISQDTELYQQTALLSPNKTVMKAAQDSLTLPTYTQRSRVPERIGHPFQDNSPHRFTTIQSQNDQVMECVQQSLPPQNDMQGTESWKNEPVTKVVEESCSTMSYKKILEKNLPPSQEHSKNNQQTMSYSQNHPDMGVKQMPCASNMYKQTSIIPEGTSPLSRDHAASITTNQELSSHKGQEDRSMEVDHIMSVLTSNPDKPSLYSYKLPKFPPDIIQKLENGIPIEAKDRSILLETLYESIVPYTYYPSASDYIYFTNLFLEQFPQLLPQAGPIRDCPDHWEAWRQKLMHKFKNKRKRKDRDVAAVQQHTRKNFKYFEGLDELQSTSEQGMDGRGDRVDSDTPSETDEAVFEVVDDDQDVVIKEEDSMYHLMAADTTNLVDTSAIGEVQESISLSPFMQSSRIPGKNLPISQDNEPYGPITSHSLNKTVTKAAQESLILPTYTQRSRILARSLPPFQDEESCQQLTAHQQNEPVTKVVKEPCSSMSYMETSKIPQRNMPSSQVNAPNQQTMSYTQIKPAMGVQQQPCASHLYRQTSRIPESALPPSRDHASSIITTQEISSNKGQEDSSNDVEHIMSVLTSDPDKPSLYSYKLPTFPADIIEKLENGIPIEAKDRSILLETLYESIIPYTYYPSASDYIYFTNLFLERFPQLLTQAGPIRDCPDNSEAWRQKLMHKFKNMRKRKDRDVAAVQQHTRKSFRYFEGLEELQSTSGQAGDGRARDGVDSDTPSKTDEKVLEVVDDEQDGVIKEEDSIYHVMAADTTNLVDTSGFAQESTSSPYMKSSRIPERNLPISQDNVPYQPIISNSPNKIMKTSQESLSLPTYTRRSQNKKKIGPPCQDDTPHRLTTLQSQKDLAMSSVQDSLFSPLHMMSSRIRERSLPPSQNDQVAARRPNERVMKVVDQPCSTMSYTKILERNLPPAQDHSQDIVPNQQTMSYSQNQPATGGGHQSWSSQVYRQISKPNKSQEETQMEDEHIMSVLTSDPDKPSLYSYKLPTFPADIVQKLENGIPIECKDRSILLETLYESIVPFTYYPSASDYIYFTNLFLERYPQLLPHAGPIRDCPDNWEAWRQKLMHKFKNMRKRKDRDVAAVQQHTRKGMDELQSTSEQRVDGRGDQMDSNTPSETDEVVFEVVDDDQDVVIKEEDSIYHVMAADTTNLVDTSGVAQESTSSPYMKISRIPKRSLPISQDNAPYQPIISHSANRIMKTSQESLSLPTYTQRSQNPEKIGPPCQDNTPHRLTTLQSQKDLVMSSVQESYLSPLHMMSSRILERSLPPSQNEQVASHHPNELVMKVVEEPCSTMAYTKILERNLPSAQDHSQDIVPNQQTMSYSQNQPATGGGHQSWSSQVYRQTSKPNKSQEETQMEDEHIMSVLTSDPDKPSLYSYKLPTFPANIIQKLENGIPIEGKDRSVLLETLYESIVPFTYYPSASDYIYFTNLFLEQYPQLLPHAGPIRDCPDNCEAWRQKLMHKFKNMRKRKDRDVAAVQQHTRKNFKYFEGLDELQSISEQGVDGRGDQVDSDTPSEADEEVFEVIDDDQVVVIKEEDSMYYVMAADTTNFDDT